MLERYGELAAMLALGAPALGAAIAIVFRVKQWSHHCYAAMMVLCVFGMFGAFPKLATCFIRSPSSVMLAASCGGLLAGFAFFRFEKRFRRARPFRTSASMSLYLLLASTEELVYRGFLLAHVMALTDAKTQLAGILTINLWFAAIHAEYSPKDVVWKAPLGLLLTATTLVSGSLVAAIALHGSYNFFVVHDGR